METYYVYKITNIINGKFYIGKRKHLNPELDKYMGSGKLIRLAIAKYGVDNFHKEILQTFDTNDAAAEFEASLVTSELLASGDVYNMHEGGHGGFKHINYLPVNERVNVIAFKAKVLSGEIKVGGDTSMFFTEDSYRRIREGSQKGNTLKKLRSQEQIAITNSKISEASKGSGNSQYGTKFYINLETKEVKRFKIPPEGWVVSSDYREAQKSNSRRWYNNGIKNFYVYLHDPIIIESRLIKGRIKTA